MYDLMWPEWNNGVPDITPIPQELLFDNPVDAMQVVWAQAQKVDQEDMNSGPTPDFIDIVGDVFMQLDVEGLKMITKIFQSIKKNFVAVRFFNPKNPKEVYLRATPRYIGKEIIAQSRSFIEAAANAPTAAEAVKEALAPMEEAAKKLKAPKKKEQAPVEDTSGAGDDDSSFLQEPNLPEQAEGLHSVNHCQKYYSSDPLYKKTMKTKPTYRCAGDYLASDGSRCSHAEAAPNAASNPKGPLCTFKKRNEKVALNNPMAWLCTCEKAQEACVEQFELVNSQVVITTIENVA